MKKTLPLVIIFGISSLATQAQTTPPARRPARRPDTTTAVVAQRRAEHYTGPKVVADSKELGQKFRRHSKPTDMRMPLPLPPVSSPPK